MFAKLAPLVALSALSSSLTGCYFWYPHDIKRQTAPPHVAGGQIELTDHDGMDYYTCGEHDNDCVVHHGALMKESPYVTTTATYRGKELTRGEVAELVAPGLQTQRWTAMQANEHTCNYSMVPSYAFAIGTLADMVGGAAVSQTKSDIPVYLFVGGAALMVLGAAISYPMGGYACTHAKRVAQQTGIDADLATKWVTHADEPGAVEAEQALRKDVELFNARARAESGATEPPAPGTDEGSGEDPAPSVEP